MAAISSSFIQNFFAEPPPSNDSDNPVAEYVGTAEGAWDVFRSVENVITWVQQLTPVEGKFSLLDKVSGVVNTAGIGLSVPAVLADCVNLRGSLGKFLVTLDLPYSDPERALAIAQASKQSLLDLASFTNNTTQAALFLERADIVVFTPKHMLGLDFANNASSMFMDSVEFADECFRLQRYFSPEERPLDAGQASKLEEKKTLSWMIIAKDAASIGAAAIALVGIVFGLALESIPVVAAAGLILSTVWLTMKITSHFYNRVVVEAPIPL